MTQLSEVSNQADTHSNNYASIELTVRELPRAYNKTVSVVIPHFDARILLERCLFGLTVQSYPSHLMEIIISDDGSASQLCGIKEKFRDRLDLRVLTHERMGFRLATVRNRGILVSEGEVILCLDCDIIPVPELIEAHLRWFHVTDKVSTIGLRKFIDVGVVNPSDVPQLMPELREYPDVPSASNRYLTVDKRLPELRYLKEHPYPCNCFHGSNIAFRKDSAVGVGLFDTAFDGHWGYEDIEFGYRLYKAWHYLVFEPQALGLHQENTVLSAEQRALDGDVNRRKLYERLPGLEQYRREIGYK